MKRVTIETLVAWAVREEWPKAREAADGIAVGSIGSGWGAVSSYAALLAIVDENVYGVVPDLWGTGEPHPDAAAVADALAAVDGAAIGDLDAAWIIGDLATEPALLAPLLAAASRAIEAETVVDAEGLRRSRRPIETVVISAAILGAKDWSAAPVRLVPMRHAVNGAEVWRRRVRRPVAWTDEGEVTSWSLDEVEVANVKGRRPVDAYRVEILAPDPSPVLTARVRHVIWRAALRAIASALDADGRLVDHLVIDDGASALPWLGLGRRAGRILAAVDLPGGERSSVPRKKNRRIA